MQAQFPTLMVPIIGSVHSMENNGHRYLMANNGVWLQVKRNWLNAVLPITTEPKVTVPYGAVNIECKMVAFPKQLMQEFGAFAKEQYPKECAARIILNNLSKSFHLEKMVPTSVSNGHVSYSIPVLNSDEELVVDIHSHGSYDAFFSDQDNKDDAAEVKVSAVIGYPNGTEQAPNWCFRLCVNGLFEKLSPIQIGDAISFKLET
jgi:PRTRC genetic system protein A